MAGARVDQASLRTQVVDKCVDRRPGMRDFRSRAMTERYSVAGQDDHLVDVWSRAVGEIEQSPDITPRQLAFVKLAQPLGLLDGTMLLAVGNDLTKDYLESRVRSEVTAALTNALGREARFAITVDPDLVPDDGPVVALRPGAAVSADTDAGGDSYAATTETDSPRMSYAPERSSRKPTIEPARLNPKYLFETFVIGSSNRFAHAAAVAVAEAPAKAYNPLFIYGSSGLGKTHLLHAIGHYATTLGHARSVRYVSTEEFTNDFINSLRDDKTQAFQRRYRDVDILLIDDIQFLENRERTQEEFFHTFNTLHNANKQIVISSDRSPRQLATLEDRMRTRFEWGLLADIQPPDLETRIAILQKKAAQERMYAPDDVLEFIASRVSNSIRELEGALIRVTAFASLNRQPVDLSLAEIVLKDLIPADGGPE